MNKNILTKLVLKGLSTRKIAEATGKSQTTVRYWLGKYELNTNRVHKCSKCGETDKTRFHPGRFSECKTCRKKWQKDRFRRLKRFYVDYKGCKCVKCGYNKCLASLDFHHLKDKDSNWKYMRRWAKNKVLVELDKCILICKNCHGEVHFS